MSKNHLLQWFSGNYIDIGMRLKTHAGQGRSNEEIDLGTPGDLPH